LHRATRLWPRHGAEPETDFAVGADLAQELARILEARVRDLPQEPLYHSELGAAAKIS
jgi:hypothetical protein